MSENSNSTVPSSESEAKISQRLKELREEKARVRALIKKLEEEEAMKLCQQFVGHWKVRRSSSQLIHCEILCRPSPPGQDCLVSSLFVINGDHLTVHGRYASYSSKQLLQSKKDWKLPTAYPREMKALLEMLGLWETVDKALKQSGSSLVPGDQCLLDKSAHTKESS